MPISKKDLIELSRLLLCSECSEQQREDCGDGYTCDFVEKSIQNVSQYAKEHGLLTEPETAWYQRSAEEIQASFDRLGYVKDKYNDWVHPIFPSFRYVMWQKCGKLLTQEGCSRIPEWVELREAE